MAVCAERRCGKGLEASKSEHPDTTRMHRTDDICVCCGCCDLTVTGRPRGTNCVQECSKTRVRVKVRKSLKPQRGKDEQKSENNHMREGPQVGESEACQVG